MSSLNALSGGVTAAVSKFSYAAAKAGILGMTRALAKEFGPTILINAICPGPVKSELWMEEGGLLDQSKELGGHETRDQALEAARDEVLAQVRALRDEARVL